MNKQFFKGMQKFASALLVIGVCGAILMILFLSVTEVQGLYSTRQAFNPTGFAGGIACFLGSIAGYYILKGIALIGLKAYEDEPEEEPQPTPEPPVVTEEQLQKELKQRRIALWTLVGILILCLAVAVVGYLNKAF